MTADAGIGELVASRRGFFWVGIERCREANGTVIRGPMFVQWESPEETSRPHPVVLVHGGGGQGTDWLGTPDGRPGWATHLVQEGFTVYVVDRPGHGRSAYHPDVLGPMGPQFSLELARTLFMPGGAPHPTAHLHTQWPGDGSLDDPLLEQFSASSGPMPQDLAAAQALDGARCAELLDRIGPAILITHSAGGQCGWHAADARPGLVRAIVAIEPLGPPFVENADLGISLDYGLTGSPLTFAPSLADASELLRATDETGTVLQAEPARRLPNLAGIPIAVVSAEASLLAHGDAATAAFLRQAGCGAEHVPLADHGVHGNGHLMMLERNSRDVLAVILDWLDRAVPERSCTTLEVTR